MYALGDLPLDVPDFFPDRFLDRFLDGHACLLSEIVMT
jgi:hypothetical protein